MCDPLSVVAAGAGLLLQKGQQDKIENAQERAMMAAEEARKEAEAKTEEERKKSERTMRYATKDKGPDNAPGGRYGRFSLRLFDTPGGPQAPSSGTLGIGR